MSIKSVLIISVYYPPIQSIATNRIYSIAKYLDKDKYNVSVLTIDDGNQMPQEYELEDVSIYRVKNTSFIKKANFNQKTNYIWHKLKALYNILLTCVVKDEYNGWTTRSIIMGKKLLAEKRIDLVISSYAPLAPHLVALELKKANPNIKWIADMRDEMSLNPYLTSKARKNLRKHEHYILQHADAVTSVSEPILESFARFPHNPQCFFREIRNGYDFEIMPSEKSARSDVFTLVYAGSFYGDCKPDKFFKVLEQLVINDEIKIKTKFIGVVNPLQIPDSLIQVLEWIGKLPHKETIKLMKQADCLLLIIPCNSRKGVYTGKIFEYLGCLKPILALVPENDVAARLIREANAGYIAAYDNPQKIREKILEAYKDWRDNKPFEPDINTVRKHHRKEQVKRLESLIEGLFV